MIGATDEFDAEGVAVGAGPAEGVIEVVGCAVETGRVSGGNDEKRTS
jgi:hypothetical protein